jgi:hypothetical protein
MSAMPALGEIEDQRSKPGWPLKGRVGCPSRQRHFLRHFLGDRLARAVHHARQRNDMGLTIHYQLATTGDEADARNLMQQLRQAALDLPFRHIGEIVELRGGQCDWKRRTSGCCRSS